MNPYWLGRKHSEKSKEKMRIKAMGREFSIETKQKISEALKGNKNGLGRIAYFKGKKLTLEHRKKMSIAHGGNGVTGSDKRERERFRFEMQKLIFERDGYECQICDSDKDLQVDHIQSWAEFKELRFDPENCRTLCAKCHYKITFKKEMPENIKAWGHNLKYKMERMVD